MSNQVEAQFIADVLAQQHSGKQITLVLDAGDAWAVLASLQLALRHPGYRPSTRAIVEPVVMWLIAQLATTEAMREVARCGRLDRFDVVK